MRGQFIRVLAPPKEDNRFFESDGDCLVQLRSTFEISRPKIVLIVMADQVAKVNYRQVIERLMETRADAVMVYREYPVDEARGKLGVLDIDANDRIVNMEEKPDQPQGLVGRPDVCLANLAMYALTGDAFFEMLDAVSEYPPHSALSRTGIPWLIKERHVVGFDLSKTDVAGTKSEEVGFFADTGTIDSWFGTQMEMCQRSPVFNFYSHEWPIYTAARWLLSPTKADCVRHLDRALLGWNVILQDRVSIQECLISTDSVIGAGSTLCRSIILGDVCVGADCHLENVVVDKGVHIPSGLRLTPGDLPPGTLSFAEAYARAKRGEISQMNAAVLSENGDILVIPKLFQF
jgi:glucose-1-phosphate adenylyltransferase